MRDRKRLRFQKPPTDFGQPMPAEKAPKCPYCGSHALIVRGSELYNRSADERLFWRCTPCDAHVGCHARGSLVEGGKHRSISDGTTPFGTLANRPLRVARMAAHKAFDVTWKTGLMSKIDAYKWLARSLGIARAKCHIGMFDVDQCAAVEPAVESLGLGLFDAG